MGAAGYVGRVGGLALALGIGGAVFVGAGVAYAATDGDPAAASDSSSTTHSTSPSADSKNQAPQDDSNASQEADDRAVVTGGSDKGGDDSAEADRDAEKASQEAVDQSAEAADPEDSPESEPVEKPEKAAPEPRSPAPREAAVELTATPSTTDTATGDPATPVPVDPPATLALAAVARREVAEATAPISYAPTVGVSKGVITGTNDAPVTSISGTELTYNVVGKTLTGGKVYLDATTGDFSYLPNSTQMVPGGHDRINVLVAEDTAFNQMLESAIPLGKYLVPAVLVTLHQIPILNVILSPLIGRSVVVPVNIDVGSFVGADKDPIAFTTMMKSFDGTMISVNYFPALDLTAGRTAPTILNGPSLATAGYIDPNQQSTLLGAVPGLALLRDGYNVVTWDPRGEFDSGGLMHLDSPLFEGKDVSSIITWLTTQPGTKFDPNSTTDPLIGMVGGSYGGGIQLSTAGIDHRVDAIVPVIAWNSLDSALYPNHGFKTTWAEILLLSLTLRGARVDPQVYLGILTGALLGFVFPAQQDFLKENSPGTVVGDSTTPTLFIQGTVDNLFPLSESLANAGAMDPQVPVRMIWYCGGHGSCLTMSTQQQDTQAKFLRDQTMAWLDTYVAHKGDTTAAATGPKFTWVDQDNSWFTSDRLPNDPEFVSGRLRSTGTGGFRFIVPGLGGSGPQTKTFFPLSYTLGADAPGAIDTTVFNTRNATYHLVGSPTVTFDYSGLGTSRNVYAQLVDTATGLVLGNNVTPIPVILDGRTHPVTVDLQDIAYTMKPGASLQLQIVDSATAYENYISYGAIQISSVEVTLPIAAQAKPFTPPTAGVGASAGPPQDLGDLLWPSY